MSTIEIAPFEFFMLRTPCFSHSVLTEVYRREVDGSLEQFFYDFFGTPDALDSLFFASRELHNAVNYHLANRNHRMPEKLIQTLYKYVVRMSTRPTPFGKFAGVCLGSLGDRTEIKLNVKSRTEIRFDAGFNDFLSSMLASEPTLKPLLKYTLNNTAHEVHGHYYYIECLSDGNNKRYNWTRVKKTSMLEAVISFVENHRSLNDLWQFLTDLGFPEDLANVFVSRLIDDQLLVPDLQPSATGRDFFDVMRCEVASIAPDSRLNLILEEIEKMVASGGSGHQINSLITSCNLLADREFGKNSILQADTKVETDSNKIDQEIVDKILSEAGEVMGLFESKVPNQLISFREKFFGRFGSQEVALMEALDPDRGVGYGEAAYKFQDHNPLIAPLKFQNVFEIKNAKDILDDHLDHYWQEVKVPGKNLELNLEDLVKKLVGNQKRITHSSGYLLGNLLSTSEEINVNNFRFNLLAYGSTTALPLMSRFSHMDEDLENQLRECSRWEEASCPDAIVAEIVYNQGGSVGNILRRPAFFDYEIPVLGKSSVDPEHQIRLSDLLISVESGKIVLRSKRLNRVVMPRLSCAHNHRQGLAVYQFLCDLQYQDSKSSLVWDWGKRKSGSGHLPRVIYKHLILSRAQWVIPKYPSSFFAQANANVITEKVVNEFNLPDRFLLADGDNELLLDMGSSVSKSIFVDRMKKGAIKVIEWLGASMVSPVMDSTGKHHTNEIVFPFKTTAKIETLDYRNPPACVMKRHFPPGSECVYFKLYCGERDADDILSNCISTMLEELTSIGLIDKWFFVRFYDPDFHLRIRIFSANYRKDEAFSVTMKAVAALVDTLLAKGLVRRIVYDTYERELERYDFGNIIWCEKLFHIDSTRLLKLLPFFRRQDGEQVRWLVAVKGVDDTFDCFNLKLEVRLKMVLALSLQLQVEFSSTSKLKHDLDINYRKYKSIMFSYLGQDAATDGTLSVLCERKIEITRVISAFGKDQVIQPKNVEYILPSIMHMYLNRVFFSHQRENEMVVYHFLSKYYRTRIKQTGNKMNAALTNS